MDVGCVGHHGVPGAAGPSPGGSRHGGGKGSAMTALGLAAFGLFGLAFGSFVTVVVHRTPSHESFVSGRSRCPTCGTTIAPRDNIPLVSYLLLRGRCRHCSVAISASYPLTELATAGLFVAAGVAFRD